MTTSTIPVPPPRFTTNDQQELAYLRAAVDYYGLMMDRAGAEIRRLKAELGQAAR